MIWIIHTVLHQVIPYILSYFILSYSYLKFQVVSLLEYQTASQVSVVDCYCHWAELVNPKWEEAWPMDHSEVVSWRLQYANKNESTWFYEYHIKWQFITLKLKKQPTHLVNANKAQPTQQTHAKPYTSTGAWPPGYVQALPNKNTSTESKR